MKIIDGKTTAELIKNEIKTEVAAIIDKYNSAPHLAAILVGDDEASNTYVSSKEKDCRSVGITSSVYRLSSRTSEEELLRTIAFLNEDEQIHGFIVQLPLPEHINVDRIIAAINPNKDVDGFHPINLGRMMLGQDSFLPATPFGILELLKRYNIETKGKNCVVLGRSNIVGTPLSIMLSRKNDPGNSTVTLCHSYSNNLADITRQADILIAAIGKPEFVTKEMVKENATVIDVGIHRIVDHEKNSGYRLIGDVKFDEVAPKCDYITPVPGGVGPMTRIALLLNTLKAFRKTTGISQINSNPQIS
ncbi:MAG TPA: bifunctional methylenetetrahydrofolate dehydrogenase/methenyltetrahydrofolate cyclohydrolase FolD [Bacteroidales bacterium]|nr:bifunctional methylenetetrahydrofolate dehydrogenase/methenyltetrahydrofolate cyclohydrolase FolD [Bacteroidales bacterium]HPR57857.1 bifunctional methylenetetrahydrofolate dehydrogenase/methenyltetrahydrofolate cyclohydrolase FolD [Bacteroidales bacterium]HRW96937.1 bifunctional methylenetetrahydrofolate dehydrogenase/methenyltetrahydrofolate cyclohydrolase FolD [Bacteroidales bacterium]